MTQVPLPVPVAGPSPFDAIKRTDGQGEWWSARGLMPLLGYLRWEDFANAIERAKAAAANSGHDADQAFSAVSEKGTGGRPRSDYRLTRYACYLVAMNGDPRKPEIAEAQTYFAIKTRQAETQAVDVSSLDRRALALMVIEAEDARLAAVSERDVARAELETAAPKARSWDVLADGSGDYSVGDAAKVLSRDPAVKLGQGRLFTLLSEYGWTYRQRGDTRWRPYQTAIETGRLSELPASHYHPRTGELVIDAPQVRVTTKGLHELHRRLGGTAPLHVQPELEEASR